MERDIVAGSENMTMYGIEGFTNCGRNNTGGSRRN